MPNNQKLNRKGEWNQIIGVILYQQQANKPAADSNSSCYFFKKRIMV